MIFRASPPQACENRLERADGRLLIVFAEVQHELEALLLLALALLREVVIKAKHLVAANGLGKSLDLDRGLLLGATTSFTSEYVS